MNKITIKNNAIQFKQTDSFDIIYTPGEYITTLKIIVKKSNDFQLDIVQTTNTKINLIIEILDNVEVNLVEIKKGPKYKIQSKIYLNQNSILKLTTLNDVDLINESINVFLAKEGSQIEYILKTVCCDNEKYEINVIHQAEKTNSNIITNGLNIDRGKLIFIVTTNVKKDKNDCCVNQSNRIINLTQNNCKIQPNLLIENHEIEANHSALIGSFSDMELFYLKRLGISHNQCLKLLIEGFLKQKTEPTKIEHLFSKYWR